MNYWNERYPKSKDALIEKSDIKLDEILRKINDKNCKTLKELYQIKNNRIERNKAAFKSLGYSPNAKLSEKNIKDNEIMGLYLFGEISEKGIIPIYVGISRTIFRRLKQHGWGKMHNEATFAYLKASNEQKHIGGRKNIDWKSVELQQEIIREYKIAIIPEKLDYDLYFMEVYFAGQLKTRWNTFKTH